jgi:alkylation response protein AidB-like acyl-CoA dehydrogenase
MHTTDYILSDKLLHQFAERAAVYDRENRFFHEDFDDLRDASYLTLPVPKELGGGASRSPRSAVSSGVLLITRRLRRSASICTSTGSGLPPICGDRATARSNGC